MSVQMTVRLSDESATYIDHLVVSGRAASRAAALDKLVRRQQRREAAQRDALIYARGGEDPELAAFADGAIASLQPGDLD